MGSRSGWGFLCSSGWGRVGRPPCDDVFGGASLVSPGEDGACWRWWWSIEASLLLAEVAYPGSRPHSRVVEPQGKRVSPLVEWCSHDTSTPWMSSMAAAVSCGACTAVIVWMRASPCVGGRCRRAVRRKFAGVLYRWYGCAGLVRRRALIANAARHTGGAGMLCSCW